MAVTTETNVIEYAGNGSTVTGYPIPFKFFANDHLVVTVTDSDDVVTTLELTTDFTISGDGLTVTGLLKTVEAWDSSHTLTILRLTPMVQPYVYAEGPRLPMKTVESNFDFLMASIQDNRGIEGPPGEQGPPGDGLPVLTGTDDPNDAGVIGQVGQLYLQDETWWWQYNGSEWDMMATSMMTLDTLEDLRNLPVPADSLTKYFVRFHSRSGDLGEGTFYWDPDFVGTTSDQSIMDNYAGSFYVSALGCFDNDGTFIKPHALTDNQPGRFRREAAGDNTNYMDAAWFGLFPYPDNAGCIANADHRDAAAVVQKAHDSLGITTFGNHPSPSGRFTRMGTINVPAGNHAWEKCLWLSPRVTIRGQGVGVTRMCATQEGFFDGDIADDSQEKFMISRERPLTGTLCYLGAVSSVTADATIELDLRTFTPSHVQTSHKVTVTRPVGPLDTKALLQELVDLARSTYPSVDVSMTVGAKLLVVQCDPRATDKATHYSWSPDYHYANGRVTVLTGSLNGAITNTDINEVAANNCFDSVDVGYELLGNADASVNSALSGLLHYGAQGSRVENIKVLNVAKRGAVTGTLKGTNWIANVIRGPGWEPVAEPGAIHDQMSCEHVNQGGLYLYEDGYPIPATLIYRQSKTTIRSLQGEASARDCVWHDARAIVIKDLYAINQGWPSTTKSNGFYSRSLDIIGDSYGNAPESIPLYYVNGSRSGITISDHSIIAGQLGRAGIVKTRRRRYDTSQPSLVVASKPSDVVWTESTQFGIRWRNAAMTYPTYLGRPVTIAFVNTGTSSTLGVTVSGDTITITAGRAASAAVSTVGEVIDMLFAHGIWSPGWSYPELIVVSASGSLATIFDPTHGASIVLAAASQPGIDYRGMGVGETIAWPDADGSGGVVEIANDGPLRFHQIKGGSLEPSITATATALDTDGTTPIDVSVTKKSQISGNGWYFYADLPGSTLSTMECVLALPRDAMSGGVGLSAQGATMMRLTLERAATSSYSQLIQRFFITGRGGFEWTVEEVERASFGIYIPTLVTVTLVNAEPGQIKMSFTSSPGNSGRLAANLEIL